MQFIQLSSRVPAVNCARLRSAFFACGLRQVVALIQGAGQAIGEPPQPRQEAHHFRLHL